jgi:hypothetical protein
MRPNSPFVTYAAVSENDRRDRSSRSGRRSSSIAWANDRCSASRITSMR